MKHTLSIGVLALALGGVVVAACSGDDSGNGECTDPSCADASLPPERGSLSIKAGEIVVVAGASVGARVEIGRTGSADGAVDVTVTGLPQGVAAAPLTIAAQTTSGELSLTAAKDAAQGSSEITLRAATQDGRITAQAKATLTVRGAPGSLDTTFGVGGVVTRPTGGATFSLGGLAARGEKIVAAGTSDGALAAFRFDAAGAPDTTFGAAGRAAADLRADGGAADERVTGVALSADGKTLALGYTLAPPFYALARLDLAGKLDPSFDGDGYALASFAPDPTLLGDRLAYALALDGASRPVFAGTILAGGFDELVVARFAASGAPDPTFGVGGFARARVDAATSDICFAVAVAPDGKILCGGVSSGAVHAGGYALVAMRVGETGAPDPSFGTAGVAVIELGTAVDVRGVHPFADGSLVLVGNTDVALGVVRLTSAGALDAAFKGGGKVAEPIAQGGVYTRSSLLDARGNVVAGVVTREEPEVRLVRVAKSGDLDATFGDGGQVRTTLPADPGELRIAAQEDGRIVVAAVSAASELVLARFWP